MASPQSIGFVKGHRRGDMGSHLWEIRHTQKPCPASALCKTHGHDKCSTKPSETRATCLVLRYSAEGRVGAAFDLNPSAFAKIMLSKIFTFRKHIKCECLSVQVVPRVS